MEALRVLFRGAWDAGGAAWSVRIPHNRPQTTRQIHDRSSQAGDYANPARGAVPSWKNQMATLSWTYWFLFDGVSAAGRVNVPALFVHSDGGVFPDNLRAVHERMRGPKRRVWSEGTQTDFYDQPAQLGVSIDAVDTFLKGGL